MASTTDANDAIIDLITETAKTLSETKMSCRRRVKTDPVSPPQY